MNKAIIWGLMILLAAGTAALGQATLPASYAGPWNTLPSGWTNYSTGTYSTDYDGGGEGSAKFDGSGDWIKVNFSGAPSTVTYYIQGNSLSGDYFYKVQESVDGSNWTDVVTYYTNNPIQNSSAVKRTNNLTSTSRYVQFLYVTKVYGNVGLDGVTIAGPGAPSVSFDPNGTTNAPVSNLFTMAVSILPSGAGLQSWNMAPAYAGPASLSGGVFSFTPAAGDNGKTFTVSVVATNSIGTSTGTATIAVTPYVAPVPIVAFSPAEPYNIMATYTQKLGIGIAPAGSGLQSWTLLPSNYAGSATVVGTNFTFTTAAADGPATYVFTVVATNVFGATTGTAEIAVSTYVSPPPPSAYICTFEDTNKTSYASLDIVLSNKTWNLTGILIGTSSSDLKIGANAARLKYDTSDGDETMTVLSPVMSNGVSTISLWYGPYGTHGTNAPTLAVEISETLDTGWVEVGEVVVGAVTVLTYQSIDVYVSTPIYVRIRGKSGLNDKSANFDNITIVPYAAPSQTPYDEFLLKYNVTPGDPGTGPDDDLDGDGVTNTNEFLVDSNPYQAP